jgi:NADH:ubiquinone oxidoreductase subunit
MGIFGTLLGWATWWDGASLTHRIGIRSNRRAGADDAGNAYFEGKPDMHGVPRRYVLYRGANDASRIPPEWHAWLHHQIEDVPDAALPAPKPWVKDARPNLTGTAAAYRPSGALEAGGRRAAATGDYEAWTPESA